MWYVSFLFSFPSKSPFKYHPHHPCLLYNTTLFALLERVGSLCWYVYSYLFFFFLIVLLQPLYYSNSTQLLFAEAHVPHCFLSHSLISTSYLLNIENHSLAMLGPGFHCHSIQSKRVSLYDPYQLLLYSPASSEYHTDVQRD